MILIKERVGGGGGVKDREYNSLEKKKQYIQKDLANEPLNSLGMVSLSVFKKSDFMFNIYILRPLTRFYSKSK